MMVLIGFIISHLLLIIFVHSFNCFLFWGLEFGNAGGGVFSNSKSFVLCNILNAALDSAKEERKKSLQFSIIMYKERVHFGDVGLNLKLR